ncbi:peptidase [Vibrio harveyi]|uniref:ATP-dependent Clp protease proteolytic subunit n=1 Tax=Vibrio harveyi TaxID=669 RepID=UPI00053952C9|nr:ATP-dependent Clp protease proteolytic subunit [Vibrio harveyi]AIV05760.1 peptidase [Vibrio harveyi]EKO3799641.1 ATP-dependent Clp protease proteolytic subunit [Vibrio harveyi]
MCVKLTKMVLPFLLLPGAPVYSAETTNVTLVGDTIHYTGTLTSEANDAVVEIYADAAVKPTTLVISSDGGDVELGMALGEWVSANKIDIEVNDYCLSSCANYVFTAGKNKYISNKAIIGFHGGLSSQEFDTSDIEASFKDLPKRQREEEIQKVLHEMQTYIGKTKEKEDSFFKKIKVKQEITTLGQSPRYDSFSDSDYSGWTYNPNDYSKLGVKNVFVKQPPWELEQLKKFGKVFIVEVE